MCYISNVQVSDGSKASLLIRGNTVIGASLYRVGGGWGGWVVKSGLSRRRSAGLQAAPPRLEGSPNGFPSNSVLVLTVS